MSTEKNQAREHDPIQAIFMHHLIGPIVRILLVGYVVLVAWAPLIWAGVTAALFVLGAGLFTAKIVFRIESPGMMLFLTPVFGLIWLLLFVLIWLLDRYLL
jgi:hypothetical protein